MAAVEEVDAGDAAAADGGGFSQLIPVAAVAGLPDFALEDGEDGLALPAGDAAGLQDDVFGGAEANS